MKPAKGAKAANVAKAAKAKRGIGALSLSSKLAELLAAVRAAEGITCATEVALGDVLAVETALRGEVPNDLLAYWIATGRPLSWLVDMTESVTSFYGAMAEDDRGWRDLARRFGHIAFDDTYNPDEGPLCAALGNDAPATIVFWFMRKGDGWEPSLAKRWLRRAKEKRGLRSLGRHAAAAGMRQSAGLAHARRRRRQQTRRHRAAISWSHGDSRMGDPRISGRPS